MISIKNVNLASIVNPIIDFHTVSLTVPKQQTLKEADFAVTRRNEFEDFDKWPLIEVRSPALNTGSLNTGLKGPGLNGPGLKGPGLNGPGCHQDIAVLGQFCDDVIT